MNDYYKYKFDHFLFPLVQDVYRRNILAFGVQNRVFIHKSLKISNKLHEYLCSIDIDNKSFEINITIQPREKSLKNILKLIWKHQKN
jgi:hypothetical protein